MHMTEDNVYLQAPVFGLNVTDSTLLRRRENHRPWMTLKGHYALCYANYASFGARHGNLKDDRRIAAKKCSPRTPLSGGMRFTPRVRGGPVARGPQTTVRSQKM